MHGLHTWVLEATRGGEGKAHDYRRSVGMEESREHGSYKKMSERRHCPDQPEYMPKNKSN